MLVHGRVRAAGPAGAASEIRDQRAPPAPWAIAWPHAETCVGVRAAPGRPAGTPPPVCVSRAFGAFFHFQRVISGYSLQYTQGVQT
jgi:hypothetical protein